MKKSWIITGIIFIGLMAISPYVLNSYNEMEFNKKRGESYRGYVKNHTINATSTDISIWKTYTDTINKFQFKYPPEYSLIKKERDGRIYFLDEKAMAEQAKLGPGDSPRKYFTIATKKVKNPLEMFECGYYASMCPKIEYIDLGLSTKLFVATYTQEAELNGSEGIVLFDHDTNFSIVFETGQYLVHQDLMQIAATFEYLK